MKDVILWSVWYGMFASVPIVMTRLLIKNAMTRAVTLRRGLSPADRT